MDMVHKIHTFIHMEIFRMRTKKESRFLLPGVRRLLQLLANTHPLVVAVSPPREYSYDQGVQSARY
jgi:hypothetical protein